MNEQLKIIISAEIDKLKKGVDEAKKKVSSFKDQVKAASANVDADIKKMGEGIATGLKAAGVAILAVGTALLALGASTTEFRQNQAQLNSAFEQAGFTAASAQDAYRELYRTIGDDDQAVESAANIAMLAQSEQDAARWAETASGILGTFHDTLQPEAFYEAANETLKLNEATGAFAQMLEQTGIMSVDEFNKQLQACETEAEKTALMLSVTEQATGAAGAAYDAATADIQAQRDAQVSLNETLAKLGEAVTPVITAFTNFASQALAAVVPYVQQLAETYMPLLQDALTTVADALGTALEFIVQHQTILAVMGGIIAGIVAAIGLYNAVAAVKAAMDAAQVTTLGALIAAQLAHAAAVVVALAPYLLIVAAIAAVIAIIVLCVKHWDEIKEAVANAWDWIKEKTQAAVEAVVNWFENMKAKIQEKIQAAKEMISNIFEQIKQNMQQKIQAAKDLVVAIFSGIKNSIQNDITTAKNIISNVLAAIKAIFSGDLGAAKQAVLNIFDSIKTGIENKINNAKTVVQNAINAIKNFFNFSWSLPSIKLPHFSISGNFSLNPPSIPKFSVSWYAKGGVFENMHLFGYGNGAIGGLGENGAEAIVPLENNLGWLDRLAGMLNERMGGGAPIVLQVDGKTFAEISVDSINALTRQRGSLGLNLV